MKRNIGVGLSFLLILAVFPCRATALERPQGPSSENRYSLQDLYKRTMSFSEQIRIAENQLSVAKKDKQRAFSVLVPRLLAFGDYIRYSEAGAIQPESGYEYGVKLQQQFTLNGKEWIGFQAAKDQISQREYDRDAAAEAMLFQTAAAYYDIVNKKKRVDIAQANVSRLKAHRKAVVTKLKLEEVPKTELLRTDAELSGAESELVVAENDRWYAKSVLARMVEIPMDYELVPPERDGAVPLKRRMDECIQTGLNRRAEIRSSEMAVELAQASVDITRGDYWPVISLEAGYRDQKTDPTFFEQGDTQYVAASMEFVVFDWGLRRATVAQERIRKNSAEQQLEARQKEIALEVERAYRDIVAARNVIRALKNKLRSASANYEAVEMQFRLGQADSLDVMDANTVLINAESELAEAEFRLDLATIGLQRAQGIFLDRIREKIQP